MTIISTSGNRTLTLLASSRTRGETHSSEVLKSAFTSRKKQGISWKSIPSVTWSRNTLNSSTSTSTYGPARYWSIRDTETNKKYSLLELFLRPKKSKNLLTMKPNQRRRRQLMKRRTQRSRRKLRKRSPRLVKLRRPRGIGNCLTMLSPSGQESQSRLNSVNETHPNYLLCICTGLLKWKKRNTMNFTKPSRKILSPLSLIFISWLKARSLSNPCSTSRLSSHRRASTNMELVQITSK